MKTPFEEMDPFEAHFQNRLRDEDSPVPDYHWDAILEKLDKADTERKPILFWWKIKQAGRLAATLAILTILGYGLYQPHNSNKKSGNFQEQLSELKSGNLIPWKYDNPASEKVDQSIHEKKPKFLKLLSLSESKTQGLVSFQESANSKQLPQIDHTLENPFLSADTLSHLPILSSLQSPLEPLKTLPLQQIDLDFKADEGITSAFETHSEGTSKKNLWSWEAKLSLGGSGFHYQPYAGDGALLSDFSSSKSLSTQRLSAGLQGCMAYRLHPNISLKAGIGYRLLPKHVAYTYSEPEHDSLALLSLTINTYEIRVHRQSNTVQEKENYSLIESSAGISFNYGSLFAEGTYGLAWVATGNQWSHFAQVYLGREWDVEADKHWRLGMSVTSYSSTSKAFSSEVLRAQPFVISIVGGIRFGR